MALFVAALLVGSAGTGIVHSLTALLTGDAGPMTLVMREIRLPLALIIGGLLGLAGAATQGYLRNPTAVTGAIGFVGLVVPRLLRPLVGARPGRLLWTSAFGGYRCAAHPACPGSEAVLCDRSGRRAAGPAFDLSHEKGGCTNLLTLKDFGVIRRKRDVLHSINPSVRTGERIGIAAPIGAGKSTPMRVAFGLIGSIGHSFLARLPPRARTRAVAWMPQSREIAWPVNVETLVMLGRTPHLGAGQRPHQEDLAAVERAMGRMDLTTIRDRTATQLSGGKQARVLIVRALAP